MPAARPRGARRRRRSPQVRGIRERCAAAPRGRRAEGPLLSPRSLLRRAGRRRPSPGLSSGGRAAGNGLGAHPPPPPLLSHPDRGMRRLLLLLRCPEAPEAGGSPPRCPSAVPLSAAARPRHPVQPAASQHLSPMSRRGRNGEDGPGGGRGDSSAV